MSSSDLETAIDGLYQGPREAFVKARNALAERCTLAGDPAGARRVRGLAKPSVSAWAVNQLWWSHREDYDALHAAGAQLAALQREGSAVAGQPANAARRAAIDRLRAHAQAVLRRAGHAASAATLRKIATSLDASAAGGSFGADATLGRLVTELQRPGFGHVLRFAPPPKAAPADPATPADPAAATPHRGRAAIVRLEHERALRELADASAVLRSAEVSDADAQDALRRAQATAQTTADALARARARARAAEECNQTTRAALEQALGTSSGHPPDVEDA